jgi:hypothetical protein
MFFVFKSLFRVQTRNRMFCYAVRYCYGYFLLLQVADLFGSAERHVFQKFGSDLRLSTLESALGKQQENPSPVQQARFLTVLRIRDILVWIRVLGSVHLSNRSGSGYFVSDLQDGN